MLNFTVGPVMSEDAVLKIGGESSPYFRTPEFSTIMKENEQLMLRFLKAPEQSRCVFLTTSGTGAMESLVMNVLNEHDKVLVINGGSFGARFAELCLLHGRDMTEIKLDFGCQITKEHLEPFRGCGYTSLLVNMGETSSGILYDMELLARFCKEEGLLLLVDAISTFLADPIDMKALGAAAVITGSQKALAVHPGISVVALNDIAIKRVEKNKEICMYLSLKEALKNGERGQTPFTPAVTTLLEIHERLLSIERNGGLEKEQKDIEKRAKRFREAIQDMPLEIVPDAMSNTLTTLRPTKVGARAIVDYAKEEYGLWLCPNGGAMADKVFRVGHIGAITDEDMDVLIHAFMDMHEKGILG